MEKPVLPNYQRIKQELLAEIEQGNYGPDKLFITQQEVCQRFQVSRITAERALNELVRDGVLVRKRGQGTFIAETPTHYDAGIAGDGPVLPDTQKVIAYIMSVTRSDVKTDIISGINQVCRTADYHILFFDSSESAEIEALNVQRAVKAGVSGIIIYPVDGHQNIDLFASVIEAGMPMVMVDRYYPTLSVDAVGPDNVAVGYILTKAFIEQGHHTIGTLWQETDCTSVQERLLGYKQAMQEARLPIQSDLATLRSYSALSESERIALLNRWLSLPTPPTVLLAANSYIFGTVALDLLHMGINIGKDITLASMDKDDTRIPFSFGSLSVLLPSYEIGCQAAEMLLKRIQHKDLPAQQQVLPVTLVPAESLVMNVALK